MRERPIAERSNRRRPPEPGACARLAPFSRLETATHLVLAEASPHLPRDARPAGRGLIAQIGSLASDRGARERGYFVDRRHRLALARAQKPARAAASLAPGSSPTARSARRSRCSRPKAAVLIAIWPFHVHDSPCACDRRGCGEARASAGARRRREATGPGRRRSAAAR